MFSASRRPWADVSSNTGSYPERGGEIPGPFDRAVLEFYGFFASRIRQPMSRAELRRGAQMVEQLASDTKRLDDIAIRHEAERLSPQLLRHGLRSDLVARAFALVREATHRHLGMRHFPVQLMGGWAMINGQLAEMQTGEGKTITALLPAVTAALCGVPVHIITVNDYLAKRDAENLQEVFNVFGLSVGTVISGQEPIERRAAYAQDVTYCTNKELVFDYLRDRVALSEYRGGVRHKIDGLFSVDRMAPKLTLRGLYFAIVDEADSVLIDEARTPLIISNEVDDPVAEQNYKTALRLCCELKEEYDYSTVRRERRVKLTERGELRLAELCTSLDGFWVVKRAREELIVQALSAISLYERDKHYTVIDQKVQIVDEHTGRIMSDRSWQRGLQQFVELKENCPLTPRRETLSRITYQRFFRRYLHLAGMTGTATEVASELQSVYDLPVVRIPTNRTVCRKNEGVRVYRTSDAKWSSIIETVEKIAKRQNRPVLVGTTSVAASEHISELLSAAGMSHVLLNARQDAEEAEIVGTAGEPGRITVATNMAGRGTDIILAEGVTETGGMHVILSEYHEAARIDRQLFGRCGRQGQNGSFEAVVSLEDGIFDRFTPKLVRQITSAVSGQGGLVPNFVGSVLRSRAQSSAERLHSKVRKETVRADQRHAKTLAFAGEAE